MKRRNKGRLLAPEEIVSAAVLYTRLEKNTVALNHRDFAADFNVLCKSPEAAADATLASQLDMERECQLAWLSENYLKYPGAWKNSVEAEAYLQERKAVTKNGLLRLRYNLLMLLGLPKGRHTGEVAKEVVEGIREWLSNDQGQDESTQDTYYELVQLGFLLSRKYKHAVDEMQQLIIGFLLGGRQSLVLRWWQLGFFAEHAGLLSKTVCGELEAISQQVYDAYSKDADSIVHYVCDAAIKLAARATNDAHKWHLLKGDFWKTQAQKRYAQDPTSFVVQKLFTDALHAYRAGGGKRQVQEVEALISATKHKVKMSKVEFNHTFDGPEGKLISAYMEKLPEWVLAGEGLVVFWRMVRGALVPSARPAITGTKEVGLFSLFQQVAFDRNRNITTKHQKRRDGVPLDSYGVILGFHKAMTSKVFADGLRDGKITLATTLKFLREQTWIGQVEFLDDAGNPSSAYRMVEWVEPAIRNYFGEMERVVQQAGYVPEMMLCIDSLSVKIEGLLRHYCRLLNPPIATNKTAANGDQQELPLEEVIKSIEEYSGEDAGYLLRYVFTREGWNVRNNIAHGFLPPQSYSVELMQMVLLALFTVATMGMEMPVVPKNAEMGAKESPNSGSK